MPWRCAVIQKQKKGLTRAVVCDMI